MRISGRPLNAAENNTAKAAFTAILTAVSGKTSLDRMVAMALKEATNDFGSSQIGRWHVIDAFTRGHRGQVSLGDLHREHHGFMLGVVAGAGLREENPDYDATELYELADKVEQQRIEWRNRA